MTILKIDGRVELTGIAGETFTVEPGEASATLYISECPDCTIDLTGFIFDLGGRNRAIEIDHKSHNLTLRGIKTLGGINPIKVIKQGVDAPLRNLTLINIEILRPLKEGVYLGYSKADDCIGGCLDEVRMENVLVDGQDIMGDLQQGDGIDIKGVRNGVFRNVTILNRSRGAMNFPGSSDIEMFDVHIENCLYGLRGSGDARWPTHNIKVYGLTSKNIRQRVISGPGIEVIDVPAETLPPNVVSRSEFETLAAEVGDLKTWQKRAEQAIRSFLQE